MDAAKKPQAYYFGCVGQAGHYLHDQSLRRIHNAGNGWRHDGTLCYRDPARYVGAVARLGHLGRSALAFWDGTVDERPGSCSVFFLPGLEVHPRVMPEYCGHYFPTIWKRFPEIDMTRAIEQHQRLIRAYGGTTT